MELARVACNSFVRISTGRRDHKLRIGDVGGIRIIAELDREPSVRCRRIAQLGRRFRRDHSHDSTGLVKRERLPRTDDSSADNNCADLLGDQCDGKGGQRNCPRSSEAARKTT